MLDDVVRVVDIDSVKVDACERTRVRDAVEDRRHTAAGATPVRPEIDDGDAVGINLCSMRDKTNVRCRETPRGESGRLTTLLN
jgi:hypothetical protein